MNLSALDGYLGLGFIVLFIVLIVVFAWRARRQPEHHLRAIPGFGRLIKSVGVAVEAGLRVHISLGRGELVGLQAGSPLVGLALLRRIAQSASTSDSPPVATSGQGALTILSQDTLERSYRSVGAVEQFDPTQGRLTGVTPFSFAAGILPVIFDEKVSSNILAGHFGAEVGLIADAAERKGALTVAGSDSLPGQAVLYATAQEPLIGEELYAAGAYIQPNSAHVASLYAQDIFRFIILVVALGGALLKLLGVL